MSVWYDAPTPHEFYRIHQSIAQHASDIESRACFRCASARLEPGGLHKQAGRGAATVMTMWHPVTLPVRQRIPLLPTPGKEGIEVFAPRRRSRTAAALVAAVALLLQSFFTAWAAAAMPAGPMLDAFGNPLCIGGSVDSGASPAGDHAGQANCCTLGCCSAAPAVGASPDDGGWLIVPRVVTADLCGIPNVVPPARPERDPGNARAPPPAA